MNLDIDSQPFSGHLVSSLVLKGGRLAGSAERLFLQHLFNGLQPSSLLLDEMTPDGAAELIGAITAEGRKRLSSLTIYCEPGGSQEPSLVAAIEGLLQEPHRLSNIVVRSEEPLGSSQELATLRGVALENPPTGDIQFEHFSLASSSWESDLHVSFPLHTLAKTFFQHLGLGRDIGTHTVNIGALSVEDIPTLMVLSKEMHSTVSTAQSARFIVLDLRHNNRDLESLRKSLKLPGGEFDQALVKEVRLQLKGGLPSAVAMLDKAVEPQ